MRGRLNEQDRRKWKGDVEILKGSEIKQLSIYYLKTKDECK